MWPSFASFIEYALFWANVKVSLWSHSIAPSEIDVTVELNSFLFYHSSVNNTTAYHSSIPLLLCAASGAVLLSFWFSTLLHSPRFQDGFCTGKRKIHFIMQTCPAQHFQLSYLYAAVQLSMTQWLSFLRAIIILKLPLNCAPADGINLWVLLESLKGRGWGKLHIHTNQAVAPTANKPLTCIVSHSIQLQHVLLSTVRLLTTREIKVIVFFVFGPVYPTDFFKIFFFSA